MAYEYKSVCVKSRSFVLASFNEDIQDALNQYSRNGWKLHTAKLEHAGDSPCILCLLIFEKEK